MKHSAFLSWLVSGAWCLASVFAASASDAVEPASVAVTSLRGEAITAVSPSSFFEGTIEVQNADNTERSTFQFAATIKKQVYNGEPNPITAAPLYPAANQIMLKHADGASIAFAEGKHAYLYCEATGLFHPLIAKLEDGHVVLATSDEGVLNP